MAGLGRCLTPPPVKDILDAVPGGELLLGLEAVAIQVFSLYLVVVLLISPAFCLAVPLTVLLASLVGPAGPSSAPRRRCSPPSRSRGPV